jgi:CheY-like chemotaxis protein
MVSRVNSYRVLLVDDDDIFAMLFKESIAEHPALRTSFEINRVADGDDALNYLTDEARHPDLILLDQRMPRMDGIAVLERLKKSESTRSIPICMLSTSNQPKQLEASYARGANFCITKPVELDQLVEKVGQMLFFFAHVMELPERVASSTKAG